MSSRTKLLNTLRLTMRKQTASRALRHVATSIRREQACVTVFAYEVSKPKNSDVLWFPVKCHLSHLKAFIKLDSAVIRAGLFKVLEVLFCGKSFLFKQLLATRGYKTLANYVARRKRPNRILPYKEDLMDGLSWMRYGKRTHTCTWDSFKRLDSSVFVGRELMSSCTVYDEVLLLEL
jgi:hypothetical protein